MKKNNDKIDFVVLWVDPSDKEWQKSRAKYANGIDSEYIDNSEERYRDFDLFKYWFRGVEKYAPWVNKVHLVTCGHVPEWLNVSHPKLHIVRHSDFMPKEALPTFNSNAIELCIHKIPGLSEQFVLFNDDVFITKPVNRKDFFRRGKPVNSMALFALMPSLKRHRFYGVVANDIAIINKNFDFRKQKRSYLLKYLSLRQMEWIAFTYPMLIYNQFPGFRNFHIGNSYLKSTCVDVWKSEKKILEETVRNKFRDNMLDVSHWVYNYWQFASGNFMQRNAHFGKSIFIDNKRVMKYISKQRYHLLCINDNDVAAGKVEKLLSDIIKSFEKILPEKSNYEK